jgi:hypothetical protein
MNLSGWGTSMMDNYHLFERYMKHHVAPECILLSTSYNNDLHYKNKLWNGYIFLGFYSFEELAKIYDVSSKINGYPATEMSKEIFLLHSLLTKMKLMDFENVNFIFYLRNILTNTKFKYNFGRFKLDRGFVEVNEPANLANKSFRGQEFDFYQKGFIPFPTEDYYLGQFIELARKHNSKVIFLPPPLVKIPDFFNPDSFLKDMKNHHVDKVLKYPDNI